MYLFLPVLCDPADLYLHPPDFLLSDATQRRFNTKTSYTQNKYNLIREDSEGYAKLVTCLNHSGEGALTDETVPLMFQEIQVWREVWREMSAGMEIQVGREICAGMEIKVGREIRADCVEGDVTLSHKCALRCGLWRGMYRCEYYLMHEGRLFDYAWSLSDACFILPRSYSGHSHNSISPFTTPLYRCPVPSSTPTFPPVP